MEPLDIGDSVVTRETESKGRNGRSLLCFRRNAAHGSPLV
jgi:hypothetical protein